MSVLGKPEAKKVVPKRWYIAAALRSSKAIAAAPGTAAEHPNRIVRLGFAVARIRLVGILTPFPHIAAHVV